MPKQQQTDPGSPEVAPAPAPATPVPPAYQSFITSDGEIRKFVDSGIQKVIDDALAQLPDNRHVAVTAYLDQGGIHGAVVARVGPNWSIVGILSHRLNDHGDLKYGAAVRWSF